MRFKKGLLGIFLIFAVVCSTSCESTDQDNENEEEMKYSIIFDKNEHGIEEIKNIENVIIITQLAKPTDNEYAFEGWYYDKEFEKRANVGDRLIADVTLYAKWEKLTKYIVTFNSSGGSAAASIEVVTGNLIDNPTTPTREGYTFEGWYKEEALTTKWDFKNDTVTANITLYAKWEKSVSEVTEYIVTFNSNGGSNVDSQTIAENDKVTNPTVPTREGYTFKGWYKEEALITKWDIENDVVTENIILYAKWEINRYTVTFKDGENTIDTSTVDYNNILPEPTVPTREGYIFDKWLLNGEEFSFATPIIDNITLTASWKVAEVEPPKPVKYIVTFNTDGGSNVASQEIAKNGKVTMPANPTKEGYIFSGWYLENVKYDFNSLVTSNIILNAKWIKREIVENTISLDIKSIYSTFNNKTDSNSKLTEPAIIDVFKLYTGIKLEKSYVNTQGMDIDFTLKSDIANSVKIIGIGASTNADLIVTIQKMVDGKYIDIKVSEPVANRKAILCELEGLEAGQYKLKTNVSLRISEFTLIEQVEKELEIEFFTVTYNTDGGSSVESQIVEKDSCISIVSNPVKEGYAFIGWYLDGSKFDFNTPITKNITLVAKWEEIVVVNPNQCTIMFNTNGGSSIQSEIIEKGSSVNEPNEPTRNGYTFLGWYLDDIEFDFNTVINESIELEAKWSQNRYTIGFDNNGIGEKPSDIRDVYVVPEELPILADSEKIFGGWYINSSLTIKVNFGDTLTEDLTLYAKWLDKGALAITEASGYLEGAYLKWDILNDCNDYNVYYKRISESDASYRLIDKRLIRQYPDYYRADVLGLAKGSYNIKVVPVYEGIEGVGSVEAVNVENHIREGYAFVNGTSSGAYNEDGTIKNDANIIYITNENKDSVTLDVNGTQVVGLQNILNAHTFKKNKELKPLCVRLIGNITDFSIMEKGDLLIAGTTCGITVEGVGDDATANGWGLRIKGASNVEVRNIGFMNCDSSEGDDLGLQQDNNHIWVHNCDFFYGNAGSDKDQAKGDGALDTKKSTYVTHSYNHFWDNGKCNLQGMKSETESNFITYHHNWYDHSDSRHPRIRTCTVHIYNNYFDGNAKYGVGVTMGASAFVENNYYRNCKNPMLSSKQGTDALGEGTFSGENGGIIKAYGNYIEGGNRVIYYQENKTSFDAYLASSRNERVPSSIKTLAGGTSYNNFDTNSDFYKYNVQAPETAKNDVLKYAGRVNGGDFVFTFDNAKEDSNYAVIPELKAKLTNYKSKLIRVLGE